MRSNFKHLILKHLMIDPLPSCPNSCPDCNNHCVLRYREDCKKPNCTIVYKNKTWEVCSIGCRKGVCPQEPKESISVKFYGKIIFTAKIDWKEISSPLLMSLCIRFRKISMIGDPCKKCDNQSRCANSGICHALPNDVPQDEKFFCECPKQFHGKYCGRWGKWYLNW